MGAGRHKKRGSWEQTESWSAKTINDGRKTHSKTRKRGASTELANKQQKCKANKMIQNSRSSFHHCQLQLKTCKISISIRSTFSRALVSIYNDSIIFFCTEIFYQRMYRLKIEHFQKFCHIVWSSFRAQGDCTKNGNIRINYVLKISLADRNLF